MAVEPRRGCGYRKVGGLYLVSAGAGQDCGRIPIPLSVCPVCSHGFKQSRGWTWTDLAGLVGGNHEPRYHQQFCPLCRDVKQMGKAGLLWIGEKFYKTPAEFQGEGVSMGFSRRIHAIPRGFKVGETWVLLAHPKTILEPLDQQPEGLQGVLVDRGKAVDIEPKYLPGIFTVWRPSRVEKLFKESERESDAVKEAIEKGITPVFVPDDDKDHQGSVYDKAEEQEEETEVEHA